MEKSKPQMESSRVLRLPVQAIRPNPAQPRKIFDPAGLQELAASIVQYGVLQPLTVRRQDGCYLLVAGERRLRAAKLAGLKEVPCIVMALDEAQSGMLALVENLQRRDLDFIEEAEGLARLMRLYGLSQEQAALRVGKSQSAVANKLRLLRHSGKVLAALRENQLSERHARALLKLKTEEERLDAIAEIVRRGMNVARTEQYIDQRLAAPQSPAPPRQQQDVRQFLSSVSRNLDLMRGAGIAAACGREETDAEIILTIRIPKQAG